MPFSWIRAEDTRIEVDENDVVIRGPRGLHAMERGLFAPLPADALVLDDGSIVTLKAVDADRPAPRHKRSRDGGSVVAPCALVGIRGLPPVERHLEASLCHDRGVERTARDKVGNKRRSAVHSNMVVVEGGDIIIAASRGVVSRIRRDGSHAWQARRGPSGLLRRSSSIAAPLLRSALVRLRATLVRSSGDACARALRRV